MQHKLHLAAQTHKVFAQRLGKDPIAWQIDKPAIAFAGQSFS
jgi:hypothetical protein